MTQVAEEARKVKEEFVANVSHELRTPLNMIIGYTELIMKSPGSYGGRLPPRLLADIGVIQRNSQHLTELINDVLDLSQVDAGRMALTKHWVSINETIHAAIVAVQPLFLSKNLYLQMDLPVEDVQAYCDGTRVREVILNLLSNAGRLTEHGGVIVKMRPSENDLIVSVSDTGPGISPQDQKRLFEPFQQLEATLHHRTGGSGLGLSISKRFVEMHGGKMWLESEVGQGTIFYFSIPVDPTERPSGSALRWLNPYQEYYPRTHISKIQMPAPLPRFVVVEGEESLQKILSRYLEGTEVVGVRTIDDGIRELERSPAQALVINESHSLGVTADMVPGLPFNTPIISCWLPGKGEAARRNGVVVDYLLKPVRQDDLLATLDSLAGDKEGSFNILIVDDDQETLQLFARIISATRKGYRVVRATTGGEAFTCMRERKPDVVLLDMVLPDMDGLQVLKEKGEDPSIRAIPVVIVSSTDFTGVPPLMNTLAVSRNEGLSIGEFLSCVRSVTEILAPESPKHG